MSDNKNNVEVETTDEDVIIDEINEKEGSLIAEVEALKQQINTLKNDYAKAYADTENMRKRLQNEFDMSKKYRIQSFALDVLPVIDNIERALAQESKDEEFKKGVQMIYQQLIQALEKEGVTKMDPIDKPFDPNFHQAIMAEAIDGKESGIVVEVLQNGYLLKDRILRAAMVKISE